MTQYHAGRHFLQIPAPTNVPDRVLRAIDSPTIDHRGPAFGVLGTELLANLRAIFQTRGPVVIYPASGTGAWEAALANTLSPGDTVLMCRTGWFATLWNEMAERLDLKPISSTPTGAAARMWTHRHGTRRRARTRSKRCAWCTTRHPPAAPVTLMRCGARWIPRIVRRC